MLRYFSDWYLWYYLFLAVMGFVYVRQKNEYLASAGGESIKAEYDYRSGLIFSVLVFLPLILISGYRTYNIGNYYTDTGAYIDMYNDSPSSLGELLPTLDWDSRSPGFQIFTAFIKQIFGADYRMYLLIIASICGLCLCISYRRYSNDVVTCAFLFFASTDFISWMENGIRQFLVVSILFAIFPLIQKRKFIPFILIVLVLFTVHKSALIAIPLYIAALGKPFNFRTIAVLGLVLAAILFVGEFTDLLDDSLQGTAYNNMVSEFDGDDGTSIIRALVYSVPAIIAVVNYKQIVGGDIPDIIKISVNLSLFTAGLYFLSVLMSGIYMGRLPIYCSLFSYILLPWELKYFFSESMSKLLKIAMFVLFLAFFVFQMNQWGV